MILFIKKCCIFTLPLLLVFIFPSLVVYYGKEYNSFKDIVATQEKDATSLFGFAYNGSSFFEYKKELVREQNPKVIALGTSRVMQLRKEFFLPTTRFTNAGGAGKSLEDIEKFIDAIPSDSEPRVIILGLDQEVFLAPYHLDEASESTWLPVRFVTTVVAMSRRIYLDYFQHKFSLSSIIHSSRTSHNIGLSALLHHDGFRSDGSYQYESMLQNPNRLTYIHDEAVRSASGVLATNNGHMADSQLLSQYGVLQRILATAKAKHCIVIGILPPYPTIVYEAKINKDTALKDFSNKTQSLFRNNDMPFFDMSSIATFGGKDTWFVDGIHGTDRMYLAMLVYMIKHTDVLNGSVSLQMLEEMMQKNKGDALSL